MRLIAECATDIAQICLFSPSDLSAEFDVLQENNQVEAALALSQEQQALHLIQTDADGFYLVHLFVQEEVPQPLLEHCQDEIVVPRFKFSDGLLCVAGAEYAEHSLERMGQFPAVGSQLQLPAGVYELKSWRMDWDAELIDDAMRQAAGTREYQKYERVQSVGCASMLITAVWLFSMVSALIATTAEEMPVWGMIHYSWPIKIWLALTTLTTFGLWFYLKRQRRSNWYQQTEQRSRAVELEYPSIVVQLKLV